MAPCGDLRRTVSVQAKRPKPRRSGDAPRLTARRARRDPARARRRFHRIDTTFGVRDPRCRPRRLHAAACPCPARRCRGSRWPGQGDGEGPDAAAHRNLCARCGIRDRRDETGEGERLAVSQTGPAAGRRDHPRPSTEDGIVDMITEQADMALALREVDATERAIARDAGLGDLTGPRQFRCWPGTRGCRSSANGQTSVSPAGRGLCRRSGHRSPLGGGDGPISPSHRSGTGIGAIFAAQVVAAGATWRSRRISSACTPMPWASTAQPTRYGGRRRLPAHPAALSLPARATPAGGGAGAAAGLPAAARRRRVVRAAGFVDHAFAGSRSPTGRASPAAIRTAGRKSASRTCRTVADFPVPRRHGRARRNRSPMSAPSRRLDAGDFAGRKLAFAGFSDGAGSATANLTLSQRRAGRCLPPSLPGPVPSTASVEIEAEVSAGPAMACDDTLGAAGEPARRGLGRPAATIAHRGG